MCKHLASCFSREDTDLEERFRDLVSAMCPNVSSLSLHFALDFNHLISFILFILFSSQSIITEQVT